jgi:hypothetical protein
MHILPFMKQEYITRYIFVYVQRTAIIASGPADHRTADVRLLFAAGGSGPAGRRRRRSGRSFLLPRCRSRGSLFLKWRVRLPHDGCIYEKINLAKII